MLDGRLLCWSDTRRAFCLSWKGKGRANNLFMTSARDWICVMVWVADILEVLLLFPNHFSLLLRSPKISQLLWFNCSNLVGRLYSYTWGCRAYWNIGKSCNKGERWVNLFGLRTGCPSTPYYFEIYQCGVTSGRVVPVFAFYFHNSSYWLNFFF